MFTLQTTKAKSRTIWAGLAIIGCSVLVCFVLSNVSRNSSYQTAKLALNFPIAINATTAQISRPGGSSRFNSPARAGSRSGLNSPRQITPPSGFNSPSELGKTPSHAAGARRASRSLKNENRSESETSTHRRSYRGLIRIGILVIVLLIGGIGWIVRQVVK